MLNPFLMLVLGLFLIMMEFYLPGAVLGIIGGILFIASIVSFALNNESILSVFLFIMFASVSLALLIKWTLWRIKKNKSKNSIYLNDDQTGYFASSYDEKLIGKQGVVLSDLRPSGNIVIEGKQYQAVAQTGYIGKGEEIIILAGQGAYYIVKLSKDVKE